MSIPLLSTHFTGLNTSVTLAELEDGELSACQNVRLWNGGRKLIQRKGQAVLANGTFPLNVELQGLMWTKFQDTEYLLAIVSGSVYDAYTGVQVRGGYNRFAGTSDVNGDWLDFKWIMGDGVHANCVATVSGGVLTVSQLTVDPCDASGVGLAAGVAGNPNSSAYSYAVRFVSALGIEGQVGAYTGTVAVVNQKVNLTAIPTAPAGQDCSARNVYRIKDGGSQYFLLTQINGNTITTYTDNTGDANLGLPMLDQSYPNSPLPPCSMFLAHQQRLYAAGCKATTGAVTGSVNVLYVSDTLNATTARISTDPTTTYQGGRFPLESPAAGTITAVGHYGSMVVCFTGGGMYLFTGGQPSTYQLSYFAAHGCASHRSLLSTQEAMFWLAPDGFYAWRSAGYLEYSLTQRSYVRVSDKVRERIDGMSATDLAKATCVFSDNRVWLSWPNGFLVYDLVYNAWYEDSALAGTRFKSITASVNTSSNRQRIYGAEVASGRAWQLDTGTTDNGTDAIPCRIQTRDLDAGLRGHNKRLAFTGGLFRAAATETLTGSLIRNAGQSIYTWAIPLSSGSIWQTVPTGAVTVRMRQRVPDNALSEFFRMSFSCNSTSGQFELIDVLLEFSEPLDAGGTNA